jgi:elongation factor Ts
MAEISASMVKELRERTGAGMMDCKKALSETAGDIEAAVDALRKKGLAAAAKKAGRTTADGLIGMALDGTKGAVVEVNSETDFVARNEAFQTLVTQITALSIGANGDVEALKAAVIPATGKSVADSITDAIGVIGENINLRRTAALTVESGVVAGYVHQQSAPGLGRMGVLAALESTGQAVALEAFGKQLAMHIAATNPQSVTVQDLDPAVVERERNIFADQARASGKPESIVEKMVEGRLRKFYEESVLLEQTWVMDTDKKVKDALADAAKAAGAAVTVKGFVRLALGEGITKETDDLAAEVAKLTA